MTRLFVQEIDSLVCSYFLVAMIFLGDFQFLRFVLEIRQNQLWKRVRNIVYSLSISVGN